MKAFLGILTILVVALGVFLIQRKTPDNQQDEIVKSNPAESYPPIEAVHDDVSQSLRFDQANALLANDPTDPEQLSEEAHIINDPDAPEEKVKEAVHSLLNTVRYFSRNKSYPMGLNVEVTNALLGDNDTKVAYLSADSLRINDVGELIDDYGTPYWFHDDAAEGITVTSAGPDRVLHTYDDITYPDSK